jgi:hypothetical protein
MTGVGFLNHIYGKHADGIDAKLVEIHKDRSFPEKLTPGDRRARREKCFQQIWR